MQLLPPQTLHYYPLTGLFVLALAGGSTSHLVLLSLLILLKPTTTQNYCNAAVSLILVPLVLLLNIHDASRAIFEYLISDTGQAIANFGRCNSLYGPTGYFGF